MRARHQLPPCVSSFSTHATWNQKFRVALWMLVALLCGLSSPRQADALPLGTFVDSTEVATARPEPREIVDGEYTCSIRREFSDSTTEHLLAIAESCYPARDLLVGIATARAYEMGADTANVSLWWCDGPGIRRVPYAVSAGALAHFLGITEDLRAQRRWPAGASRPFSTNLVYRASITRRARFTKGGEPDREVWIARLQLKWVFDDGTFVSTVKASRAVSLSRRGEVLSIKGDGQAETNTAISSHRGIGRAERLMR